MKHSSPENNTATIIKVGSSSILGDPERGLCQADVVIQQLMDYLGKTVNSALVLSGAVAAGRILSTDPDQLSKAQLAAIGQPAITGKCQKFYSAEVAEMLFAEQDVFGSNEWMDELVQNMQSEVGTILNQDDASPVIWVPNQEKPGFEGDNDKATMHIGLKLLAQDMGLNVAFITGSPGFLDANNQTVSRISLSETRRVTELENYLAECAASVTGTGGPLSKWLNAKQLAKAGANVMVTSCYNLENLEKFGNSNIANATIITR